LWVESGGIPPFLVEERDEKGWGTRLRLRPGRGTIRGSQIASSLRGKDRLFERGPGSIGGSVAEPQVLRLVLNCLLRPTPPHQAKSGLAGGPGVIGRNEFGCFALDDTFVFCWELG
jgi:hypothetical protein